MFTFFKKDAQQVGMKWQISSDDCVQEAGLRNPKGTDSGDLWGPKPDGMESWTHNPLHFTRGKCTSVETKETTDIVRRKGISSVVLERLRNGTKRAVLADRKEPPTPSHRNEVDGGVFWGVLSHRPLSPNPNSSQPYSTALGESNGDEAEFEFSLDDDLRH
jgi:hypothetical protein